MIKQTPSPVRIAAMLVFALSCFGILLYLWLTFGGSIPLEPKSYQVHVEFPEATTLADEADVRISGVTVGKVKSKVVKPALDRTDVVLEIDPKYAPIPKNTRAILRAKTLLGETYVELTPGTRGHAFLKDDGRLPTAQVEPTVELDEIFQAFDPGTRQAFHIWQQELATTITNRGQDFSDALGNLPAFATSGSALLNVRDAASVTLAPGWIVCAGRDGPRLV